MHLDGFTIETCVIFEVTVNNRKSQSLQFLKRDRDLVCQPVPSGIPAQFIC